MSYFFSVLLLIFQAIFDWSTYPMDMIDNAFTFLSEWLKINLPPGDFSNLISEGIIPGLGGDCYLYSTNRIFIFIYFHPRRNRIHESCGLFNG